MITHKPSGRTLASQIEFMDTPAKRTKGLLKFKEAPESYAAIFNLPWNGFLPLIHTLGMKFPIDMVFCNRKKEVLHCYKNIRAGRFVLPVHNLFGGCAYLVEFVGCNLGTLEKGEQLSWGDS